MYPPKSLFTRLVEAAALFLLATWLVRTGICLLQSVWPWLVGLAVLTGIITVVVRLRRHYRDTHF